MTKKFRIWGLVQDRLSPTIVTQIRNFIAQDEGNDHYRTYEFFPDWGVWPI